MWSQFYFSSSYDVDLEKKKQANVHGVFYFRVKIMIKVYFEAIMTWKKTVKPK